MFGSMLLLNALGKFDFCSLIGICGGNDGGVLFLSCCGINSSSIGFGRNTRDPKLDGVVTPLPVDCIELFILLLLFVFVLLLLIGAVAFTELFIVAGGKVAVDDVVRPDIKSMNVFDIFNNFVTNQINAFEWTKKSEANLYTTLLR